MIVIIIFNLFCDGEMHEHWNLWHRSFFSSRTHSWPMEWSTETKPLRVWVFSNGTENVPHWNCFSQGKLRLVKFHWNTFAQIQWDCGAPNFPSVQVTEPSCKEQSIAQFSTWSFANHIFHFVSVEFGSSFCVCSKTEFSHPQTQWIFVIWHVLCNSWLSNQFMPKPMTDNSQNNQNAMIWMTWAMIHLIFHNWQIGNAFSLMSLMPLRKSWFFGKSQFDLDIVSWKQLPNPTTHNAVAGCTKHTTIEKCHLHVHCAFKKGVHLKCACWLAQMDWCSGTDCWSLVNEIDLHVFLLTPKKNL